MHSSPNAFTSFQSDTSEPTNMLESGDVALVLKRDGTCRAITFGFDRNRLLAPEHQQTDEDKHMINMGAKLFALTIAVTHEKLMSLLLDISTDPAVVDMNVAKAMSRLN